MTTWKRIVFYTTLVLGGGYGLWWSITDMGTPGATFVAGLSKFALLVGLGWFVDTFFLTDIDTRHELLEKENHAYATVVAGGLVAAAILLAFA